MSFEHQEYRRRPGGIIQLGVSRPRRFGNGAARDWHPTIGRGRLVAPDGTDLWVGEWVENALHDQGEKSMLDVYLLGLTNPQKYLALANQGSVTALADTVIFTGITEAETPGTHGYARPEVTTGNWGTPALNSGDMQTTAAVKTFGPNSDAGAWTVSHVLMTTAATGTAGLLILSVPLSSAQTVNLNIAFTHELSWKQQ